MLTHRLGITLNIAFGIWSSLYSLSNGIGVPIALVFPLSSIWFIFDTVTGFEAIKTLFSSRSMTKLYWSLNTVLALTIRVGVNLSEKEAKITQLQQTIQTLECDNRKLKTSLDDSNAKIAQYIKLVQNFESINRQHEKSLCKQINYFEKKMQILLKYALNFMLYNVMGIICNRYFLIISTFVDILCCRFVVRKEKLLSRCRNSRCRMNLISRCRNSSCLHIRAHSACNSSVASTTGKAATSK